MCTATYLPLGLNQFVLTHSRDEKAIRPAAHPPRVFSVWGQAVTFPQDPKGNGTWIAMSATLTACLLNGAFVAHTPKPPYRHSRGLVVLAAFDYVSIDAFIRHHSFTGIEPFTLIMAETGRLTELRWNGKRLFITEKDPRQPHIWSSVTLYSNEEIQQRERWFAQWRKQTTRWTMESIRQFHKTGGDGNPHHSIRMNRNNQYYTVSLTSVLHNGLVPKLYYEDLLPQTHAPLRVAETARHNTAHLPVDHYRYATA